LHIYDSDPCVTRQIDFARTAFAAGVAGWGRCWGVELGVGAVGGAVPGDPRRRGVAIAPAVTRGATPPGPPPLPAPPPPVGPSRFPGQARPGSTRCARTSMR